jgi:LmbE family N-acetylglucosaminyl deacetylase
MKFYHPGATVYIPDGADLSTALSRTTHLGIGAHQDDLEIMAFHGIRLCYDQPELWFGGITCTDGGGSARTGIYGSVSDSDMIRLRKKEQEKAALLGKYGFVAQLDYPSAEIKDPTRNELERDLTAILEATTPQTVYTHNPADKHDSHIAVLIPALRAIRNLPPAKRPTKVYGCEVWRDLDWMMDADKVALDVSDTTGLGHALVDVFDSQITGGKRYDEAAFGRRRANATFYRSHELDDAGQIVFAMDLSPLAADDGIDIIEYVDTFIQRFRQDVISKLAHQLADGR